jgi:copper homeostasis protein
VELCGALADGGVTPSAGLVAMVREKLSIGIHVMIRPRASDFCYSDEELGIMRRDILQAKDLGADGVVFGILDLAAPMKVTFHRALDITPDLIASLQRLQATGVHFVLTSGGAMTLKRLVDAAENGIRIMAAGGIEADNVSDLLEYSGVREVHASLRSAVSSSMRYQNHCVSMGSTKGTEYHRLVVDEEKVRKLLSAATKWVAKAVRHSEKTLLILFDYCQEKRLVLCSPEFYGCVSRPGTVNFSFAFG